MKTLLITGFAWACCVTSISVASENLQLAQSSNLFGGDTSSSMQIDIMPADKDNTITTQSRRVLAVAIMGSPTLEVIAINPRTIRLQGLDVMLVGKSDKSLCKQIDLNADGHDDLLCDVRTTGFRVEAGSYTIQLKAETYDKARLSGKDKLRIVSE